ncbi:MAG: carboxylating nicotinate-nucleotide diphosphorylase [Candidatus Delongbacteria bacterium]|jgi:nicotinate-nucleotide pyrophosphorylase (carboxylating)|nr:carboxylating nicotinate-nucleotide diphosphorylase [Candidatus Delongbacteria bacterium]
MDLKYKELIKLAFEEDIDKIGDITTNSIIPIEQEGKAILKAKENGVVSGIQVFKDCFEYIDETVKVEFSISDGGKVSVGDIVATINGKLNSILKAERTALNFIQRMSGISTLTSKFSEKLEGPKTKILDTRKTLPGFRSLDKYAVKMGGGKNHRIGLYDMFLIKDNHVKAAGSVGNAIVKAKEYKINNALNAKIEVEIKNIDEFKEALQFGADIIMLDNMSREVIMECVKLNAGTSKLEISGNVTLENIERIADTGVDYISSGALTHSVKGLDLSLLVL